MNKNTLILALLLVISLLVNFLQFNGKVGDTNSFDEKEFRAIKDSLTITKAKVDSLSNIKIVSSTEIIEVVRDSIIEIYPNKDSLTAEIRDSLIQAMLENKQIFFNQDSVVIAADDLYIALRDGVICKGQLMEVIDRYDKLENLLEATRELHKDERYFYDRLIEMKKDKIDYLEANRLIVGGGIKYNGENFGYNVNFGARIKYHNDILVNTGVINNQPYIGVTYNRALK
jgi:hypothetical protein